MATSVIPAVIDALVSSARTALPNLTVYDGYGVSDDPGDYLMVGVDDPDTTNPSNSGDSVQAWAHANHTARDETGDITCAACSWNGQADQKAARDAAFATCAAVENLLREAPGLGVPQLLWAEYGTTTTFTQNQSDTGALALVIFRVHFRARI